MAFLAVGLAFLGAFALADEVEHNLHLLGEAQGLDLNHLRFALRWTLLGLDGNLKGHLGSGEFKRVIELKWGNVLKMLRTLFIFKLHCSIWGGTNYIIHIIKMYRIILS